ncbi:protein draper-like isoform X1 [Ostrea edulis]|uniref:protein draper-like isoform X1 n=1 Tax=Ostrea edulis TaxID=37623 RepID=UPI0024AF0808|nr:protein draper-like isoform X1 [Ostrea edulis]
MIPKHLRRLLSKSLLLLYVLQTVYALADMNENGKCVGEKNTTNCCENYAYNASVEECVECVGRFGYNCSQECLDGFYGRSCNSKCNCSNQTCNKISGCLKKSKLSEKAGICYDKENDTYCCTNYMYLKQEHRCQDCVGRFGVNCSKKCPEGYYGKQCNEKCTCNVSQCDEILGYLGPSSEFGRDGQSILQIVLPASLATGTLLLCITVGFLHRFSKKKHTAEIQIYHATTTNVEQEEYSACNYAASREKRVTVMLQHDTPYQNAFAKQSEHEDIDVRMDMSIYQETHIAEDFDTEYSMSSEFEDLYDNTACMASSDVPSVERMHSSKIEC